ncbi:hypothetical protein DFJ73DRAFT_370849 [Zopfochytrium polystomum]|nr:hypothetical protein DFJ73DRAFT_370849 [Zopfochytrium polystomum]
MFAPISLERPHPPAERRGQVTNLAIRKAGPHPHCQNRSVRLVRELESADHGQALEATYPPTSETQQLELASKSATARAASAQHAQCTWRGEPTHPNQQELPTGLWTGRGALVTIQLESLVFFERRRSPSTYGTRSGLQSKPGSDPSIARAREALHRRMGATPPSSVRVMRAR